MRTLLVDDCDSCTANLLHLLGGVNAGTEPIVVRNDPARVWWRPPDGLSIGPQSPSERRPIANERCPPSSERHLRVDCLRARLHGNTITRRVGTAEVALLRIPG